METQLGRQLLTLPVPENDLSNWGEMIVADSAVQKAWLTDKKTPKDTVMRAASIVHAIEKGRVTVDGEAQCPFRWGKLATTGILPFKRMLHSTMIGLNLREIGTLVSTDVNRARQLAGQVWRHIKTAGEWRHDAAMIPTYLTPEYVAHAQYVIDVLTLIAIKKVDTIENARRHVSFLHLAIQSPSAKKFTFCASAAKEELATNVFKYWVRFKQDPRYGASNTVHDDSYVATVCQIVMPLVNAEQLGQDMSNFVSVNLAAYGKNQKAQLDATRDKGILAPLVSAAKLASVYSMTHTMPKISDPIELPTTPAI